MEQYKKDFIDFMVECQVLKFGSFVLKSGRTSPFFMNAGAYVNGSQLQRLGKFYAQAIHDNFGDDFDVLFGPAYKGIPLAVTTAIAYSELYGKEVKYCSDRKEEKDHGADKGGLLGYKIKDGDRVVIIEDVTTSGKSIEETYPKIKAQESSQDGIKIVGEIVSLDRREKAPDSTKSALATITDKYGFPARSIVSMDDVVQALYTEGDKKVITDEIKAEIDKYYQEWGAKD
ncbi:MAG: orotate phosphoribosyltransferase [Treponema sp.]|nr:orotate phosphoribosyltransferase [Treponema sp.]